MKEQSGNLLIIDDEDSIRDTLKEILEDEGYRVFAAEDGQDGLAVLRDNDIDVVFLDIWLPRRGGIDVLGDIKSENSDIEVVIISGHANVDLAVKAIKLGAYDFLEKPLDIGSVLTLAGKAVELKKLKTENRSLKSQLKGSEEKVLLIGESQGINHIRKTIAQGAPSDSRILILGENGTGKELIARMIHQGSPRLGQPFIEVNCAAIPDNLIESELFGHEKGAFTGAVGRKKGKFELADGGTLFLDEVADMSLNAQAKVLRAIQEMVFERVGGEESIRVDVRIIAATNKDIRKEVEEGRFREDLYFRLNVIPINVPPLQEREGDVVLLLEHFINQFSAGTRQFTAEAMEELSGYAWPGNIRELRNFVERINVMSDDNPIGLASVSTFLHRFEEGDKKSAPSFLGDLGEMKLSEARDEFEKRMIIEKLEENGYNVSRTAGVLGLYPGNLHNKIKKYGIDTKK
ncbi:MAG: sigma-54 dependent transcriptional regulator [Spirochaetales bacterium]|nr:sigma-54 dependent transcriptional regulator [Spirochaetales bacterium]